MARTHLVALLLVPLAFMLMGSSKVVLTDPQPLSVPSGLKVQDVARAIKMGVASRQGWTITKEAPGTMEATLNTRGHMLKVNIPYSATSVGITYVDSQNLDYSEKKGVKYIHEKWVGWTRNLLSDIQRSLQVVSSK